MKYCQMCPNVVTNSSKNDLPRLTCENQTLKACEMDPQLSCLRGINDAFALIPSSVPRRSQHEPTKQPDGSHLVEVAQTAKEPWRKLHGTLRPSTKSWTQECCPASCVRPCASHQCWMCEAERRDSPPSIVLGL